MIEEWITTHIEASIVIVIILIIILFALLFRLGKKKRDGNLSSDIYKQREKLRELDKLLEDLQGYFLKVEKKLGRRK